VIVADVQKDKGEAQAAALRAAGGKAKYLYVDVTDAKSIAAFADAVQTQFGTPDVLINGAGWGTTHPFWEGTPELWDKIIGLNFIGPMRLTKAFLPLLLARPEGHIVNVSSMGGFLPVPGQTVYGASKAAVKLLTEGLHSECAGTSVHVTVVFPGAVATNITTNSGVDIPMTGMDAEAMARRTTSADKAARIILDGMERNAYRVMVGGDAKLMDRLYRLSPRRAAGFIANQMKDLLGP